MAKLSEVFTLQMGKTPARAREEYWNTGDNAWVSIADLSTFEKYVGHTKETISDLAVKDSGIKPVPADTVIMSFKLSIGKTAITVEPVYTNEAIMAFIPNGRYPVCSNYFYHLFRGRDWSRGTNRAVMGTTLNKATLGEIDIDIPTLEEQQQIAELLDEVDALIYCHKQQLVKLDELVKSRFIELFGDPETNPNRWSISKLSEFCDLQNGYAFKSDDYLTNSTVLNCRMSNIRPDGGFDADYHPKYLPDLFWEKYKDYRLVDGDVIIAMTDMASDPKILGVPTIVRTNGKKFLLNQRVGKLTFFDNTAINNVYLMFVLSQKRIRQQLVKSAGGSTQINVGKPAVLGVEFFVPPMKLQEQFAAFVEQTDKSKAAVQRSIVELEELKKSLVQQYFG